MLLNVGSIRQFKLLLLGCVVISDLHLFQGIVLLKSCFMLSKNSIWSFTDEVTTGTQSLALFILNLSSEVDAGGIGGLGELAFGSGQTYSFGKVLYIQDITRSSGHVKLSFTVNER